MPRKTHTDKPAGRNARGRGQTSEIRTPRPKPKIDFTVEMAEKPLRFLGALSFVNDLQKYIPADGFSDPPFLDISTSGIRTGYTLALPDIQLGAFTLRHINLGATINLPFTGADSKFFDPTREEMQAAADAHGVNFAKGYRVTGVKEAQRLVKNLRYPIMVKHPKSYGSTGMTRD